MQAAEQYQGGRRSRDGGIAAPGGSNGGQYKVLLLPDPLPRHGCTDSSAGAASGRTPLVHSSRAMTQNSRRGRPPAGPRGQARVRMRHQISARLPEDTYAQLKALAAVLRLSQADVIARGFEALERSLDSTERRLVGLLRKRQSPS